MKIYYDKKEARLEALKMRTSIQVNQNFLEEQLKGIIEDGMTVAIYYPLRFEVDLLFLLKYKNIKFVFPKVVGDKLLFYSDSIDTFIKGPFHLLEPRGEHLVSICNIDLFFIPCVAVNLRGYRLGYGKGYYDKSLVGNSAKKIAVLPKELVLDFKEECYDLKMDEVILCTQ